MRSNAMTSAAGPPRDTFEPKEPRCRVCRDEAIRVLVNQLLDWRGAPIFLGPGKVHVVTYTDILRDLEPLNARLDKGPCREASQRGRESGVLGIPDRKGVGRSLWAHGCCVSIAHGEKRLSTKYPRPNHVQLEPNWTST
jgi:hypothetical protein